MRSVQNLYLQSEGLEAEAPAIAPARPPPQIEFEYWRGFFKNRCVSIALIMATAALIMAKN
jgi:hypothetical protein